MQNLLSSTAVPFPVTDSPGETDPRTGVWSTDMFDCPGKCNIYSGRITLIYQYDDIIIKVKQ